MSSWLKDDEVLEGTGSGQMSPSSRLRSPLPGRMARLHSSSDAPSPSSERQDRMSKAKELFELCDKEKNGFITKRDMQWLQQELPLSPEQLESVFESLDRDKNGYLTPLEFHTGLGELVGCGPEESARSGGGQNEVGEERVEPTESEIRFSHILMELGADKLFKDQWELCTLWGELQRDKPELLGVLEEVLSYTVSHLQDALKERDNLEQALRRREEDHDRVVRSMYEDMETQLKEEREKRQALLESRISNLSSDQADARGENRRLQNVNQQLQDQLDQSREELQHALSQLQQLQDTIKQQHRGKEREVLKVSRNMQKERESLIRQLDLLRDMNKRLRDDKDAHQTQKMVSQKYPFMSPTHYPPCRCVHAFSPWARSVYPY
ncbi:EF-hand calcium-binding domain-containing protein 4A isoform X2 [Pseudorasbora parva]|uniref:EF-hand calcium-binding domain-containing protein 4A isoform X2 n=1 Tax=Pseudorasbora parva TaxID=51549 RepID=UPI00351E5242